MTKLGIIGAMQVEVEILLGRMENQTSRTVLCLKSSSLSICKII